MFPKNKLENLLSGLILVSLLLSISMGTLVFLHSKTSSDWAYVGIWLAGLLQGYVIFILWKRFFKPLESILQKMRLLAGEDANQRPLSSDKLALLSDFFTHVAADIKEATDFAVSIGNGNLDSDFKNTHGNELKKALEEMRDKLSSIAEQEKRRIWHVNGISHFNDLLRQHLDDPDAFYFNITKQLVQQLKCTQGGLYLLHEENDNIYLELAACYAYERRKHHKQQILAGEGLLGQCIREKDTIFLTDIPDDYISITSGLGKANPTCILIVPLIINDNFQGVIEVASFQVLEPFQVSFVEALSENIAATLATFKTNKGITRLLSDSQHLNDQLRVQEEETQRNMEELQRTQFELQENMEMMQQGQKEMSLKQVELTGLFNSINTTLATMEFDKNGVIFQANDRFLDLLGYQLSSIEGQHHRDLFGKSYANGEAYDHFWEQLLNNQTISDDFKVLASDLSEKWLSATYTPTLDANGHIYKIIMLAQDITERKKDTLDFQCKLKAISESNAIVEFDMNGHILEANANFLAIVGYQKQELLGKHHHVFVQPDERTSDEYQNFWRILKSGNPIRDEFIRINKYGREVWLRGTYSPIFDLNNKPYKIVKFAIDISHEKNLTLATRKQERQLQEYLKAINLTIASVEFDLNGEILEVNQIFLGVTGYSYEELIGQPESILFSNEELLKPQHELLWSNLKVGKFFEGEFKLCDRNGKSLWMQGTYNPIFDLNGTLVKITMLAHFTTDEKEKQIELNGIVNAIKNATLVLELNLDGSFRNASQKLLDLLGFKRQELRNRPLVSLLANQTQEVAYEALLQKLSSGEGFETALALNTLHGPTTQLKANFTPVTNLEGQINKIVAVLA